VQWRRFACDDVLKKLVVGVALKGWLVADQFVGCYADRPYIARGVSGRLSSDTFRRDVTQRANDRSRSCAGAGLGKLGEAGDSEIENFYFIVGGDEDIAGFDVAVDDAAIVSVLQPTAYLKDVSDFMDKPERGSLSDDCAERLAIKILHDDVWEIVCLIEIVDGDDIRVLKFS